MDQVSGRYDAGLREQEGEDRSYTGPRKKRAAEYLRQWLGLRDTEIWDRGEVGEVVAWDVIVEPTGCGYVENYLERVADAIETFEPKTFQTSTYGATRSREMAT